MISADVKKGTALPTSIEYPKLEFSKGAEHATVWVEGLKRVVNRLPEDTFKTAIVTLLETGQNYVPAYVTKDQIKSDHGLEDEEHVSALHKELSKTISLEIIQMKAVRVAVHGVIRSLMSTGSMQVLRAESEFKSNDDSKSPDPTVIWDTILKTHITQREGKNALRKVLSKANAIVDILNISQRDDENIVDFADRLIRRCAGLKANYQIDIVNTIFSESELATLWTFRLNDKYASLQRDMENGIVAESPDITTAVNTAKDRVEVASKDTIAPVSTFLTESPETNKDRTSDRKSTNETTREQKFNTKRDPLSPYPMLPRDEWAKLSKEEKSERTSHNKRIRDAARSISKPEGSAKSPKKHDDEKKEITLACDINPGMILMIAEPEKKRPIKKFYVIVGGEYDGVITEDEEQARNMCRRTDFSPGGIFKGFQTRENAVKHLDKQRNKIKPVALKQDIASENDILLLPAKLSLVERQSSDLPPMNVAMGLKPNSSFLAPVMKRYYAQDHETGEFEHIGRSLQCYEDIKIGQPLLVPNGNRITRSEGDKLEYPRNQYLIEVSANVLLDCFQTATQNVPMCFFSMANSANNLIRTHPPPCMLGPEDNNAACIPIIMNGVQTVVLYAIQDIPRYTDIMWDYDCGAPSVENSPNVSMHWTTPMCWPTHYDKRETATNNINAEPGPFTISKTEDRLETLLTIPNEIDEDEEGIPSLMEDESEIPGPIPSSNGSCDKILMTTATGPFNRSYVVWDCASGAHLCKNTSLASKIRKCEPSKVRGIVEGSESSFEESCEFLHPAMGRVALARNATANIMSQSCALDAGCRVRYDEDKDTFNVTHPNHELNFQFGRVAGIEGKSKHYVMDPLTFKPPVSNQETIMAVNVSVDSIAQRSMKYTKAQNSEADAAMEFLKVIGYPTETNAIKLVERMLNPPTTRGAIHRAFEIYGNSLEKIRGVTTKTTTSKAEPHDELEVKVAKEQVAEVDLMFVREQIFLICLLSPLEFSFVVPIKSKSIPDISNALQGIISAVASRGFRITTLRVDNEPAIASGDIHSMLSKHEIVVDTVASGDHAHKVERRIRFVKEKWRVLVNTLPYCPNAEILNWGVVAANRLSNMQTSSTSTSPESPREKFLGRMTDYKRDCAGIPFGAYVQCTVPNSDNSDQSRVEAGIALLPKDNQTGTFYVLKLKTNRVISRSHLVKMPINDQLAQYMNVQARRDGFDPERIYEGGIDHEEARESKDKVNFQPFQYESRNNAYHGPQFSISEPNTSRFDASIEINTKPIEEDETPHKENDVHNTPASASVSPVKARRSARLAEVQEYPYWKPDGSEGYENEESYTFAASVAGNMTCKDAIDKHGDPASDSITAEMLQLVHKQAIQPVCWNSLSDEDKKRIIPSKMFLKAKHKPDGSFERLKARIVARGDRQNKNLYDEDLSAGTVSSMSVMTIAAIASHEERKVAVVDITGAFLHARMDEENPVYVRIEPILAAILVKHYPEEFQRFLDPKTKSLLVKLLKALYGTIEAAKRWLVELLTTLNNAGYTCNDYDECVLNFTDSTGTQCTICLYVDDLFITCKNQSTIQQLVEALKDKYGDVKAQYGDIVDYLGMTMDFTMKGCTKITMDGMIQEIINDFHRTDLATAKTPATENLLEINDSASLCETDRKLFHSMVARLMYVCKKVKPECLMAVNFLATRVQIATEEDDEKLERVIRYLKYACIKDYRGILLKIGESGVRVATKIDAAHGVHMDYKSHTGAATGIGEFAIVDYYSGKQSIVAKSSTEAELIGATDLANQSIKLRNFLIDQGYQPMPAIIYQDNQSSIALIKKGSPGSMRSRHIGIRYFWLHEQCEREIVEIVYLSTKLMGAANILTKPVVGSQFIVERDDLTNWDKMYAMGAR